MFIRIIKAPEEGKKYNKIPLKYQRANKYNVARGLETTIPSIFLLGHLLLNNILWLRGSRLIAICHPREATVSSSTNWKTQRTLRKFIWLKFRLWYRKRIFSLVCFK